jgi:hypothetical protein
MAFGRNRARTAPGRNPATPTRKETPWPADDWMQPLPAPEVQEGGESMWDTWQEESRRMDLAFAETQPSSPLPLTPAGAAPVKEQRKSGRWTADEVIALARCNNRVCPRPLLWSALYALLEGERYADLRPPPTQAQTWGWATLSNLQRRLLFRDHIEWADRHGKLEEMARFLASLAEPDWAHMDDS